MTLSKTIAMTEEFYPTREFPEALERILNSKSKAIIHHAEYLHEAVKEQKPEKALAILRILLAEAEITEQGLLQGT